MSQDLFTINDTQPLQDYQNLIKTRVQCNEIVDDDVIKENFKKITQAAHDVIWRLLFNNSGNETKPMKDPQRKAAELLEEYKGDACFYDPWSYNEWIVKLRDEVLKHQLLDFWRNIIVEKQLGPCWSRDSDLFDGNDAPPIEFYAHAGCVAPFAASLTVRAAASAPSSASALNTRSIDDIAATTGNFDAKISKTQPLTDYRNLMKRFVLVNVIVPDEVHKESVNKISTAVRDVIWSLLFEGTPTPQEFEKAIELLQEYKSDACFYGPWEYNEWIIKIRDELLKRELIDIWRDKIVQLELGPCCSRDSDFFDASDALPTEFYNKAGCKAPFDEVTPQNP